MDSQNHKIEDAVLTVINDGDGSQCGMTYRTRCAVAETGLVEYYAACKRYQPSLTHREAREAAELLQAYYREHVQELALLNEKQGA